MRAVAFILAFAASTAGAYSFPECSPAANLRQSWQAPDGTFWFCSDQFSTPHWVTLAPSICATDAGSCVVAVSLGVDGGIFAAGDVSLGGSFSVSGFSTFSAAQYFLAPGGGVFQQLAPGYGFSWFSNRIEGDPGADYTFNVIQRDPSTPAVTVCHYVNGILYCPFRVTSQGDVQTSCIAQPDGGPAVCGSFVDQSNLSGHPALTTEDGFYLNIQGNLPQFIDDAGNPYGGIHGNVGLSALHPQDAGMLVQSGNFFVDYRGAVVQLNPDAPSHFDHCGARIHPNFTIPPFFGNHYYNEWDSALRWGNDHKYHVCEDDNPDGGDGPWGVVCTSTNGECAPGGGYAAASDVLSSGTKTETVPSGARCVCSSQTTHALTGCSVSGTTLSVAGTGTDAFTYICL